MFKNKMNSSTVTSSAEKEDDGSVFTEENGIKVNIHPGELVRFCGVLESSSVRAYKYGQMNTVMPVWLESKTKLNTEDVKEALTMVSRQVPSLQFCHAKVKGKIWLKRMSKFEVDLETTSEDEVKVMHDALETNFDLWNGPLWKVKLIEAKEKNIDNRFCFILFLIIFHSINDGITNMKIVRDLVSVLNQLTTGRIVTPVFSPVINPIDKMARQEVSVCYLLKKTFFFSFATLRRMLKNEFYFSGNIPCPTPKIAETKVLFDVFSENETEKILKMCKEKKVTVNTFVCTVVNFALMSVAQRRSKKPIGTRQIVMAQSVNIRRYFEPQYSDVCGFHTSVLQDVLNASLSDGDDFWQTASYNQLQFKEGIEVKRAHMKIIPIYRFSEIIIPINQFLVRNGLRCQQMLHYSASNMGNVDNLIPDTNEEDNVKVTFLTRSVSLHLNGVVFTLNFETFRKKLSITINYFTNSLTEEVAKELFSTIYKYIRNMITHQRLIVEVE